MKRQKHDVKNKAHLHQRRAVVSVMMALLGTVLIGFAALSVDVGYMYTVRSETQNAVDVASLAAAAKLGDSSLTISGRLAAAEAEAEAYIEKNINIESGRPYTVTSELGRWDATKHIFTSIGGGDPRRVNAIRVKLERPQMTFRFAGVFGKKTFSSSAEAVACLVGNGCKIYNRKEIKIEDGGIIDSYDAFSGSYGGEGAEENGTICSCDKIEVKGSSKVYGDVYYYDEFKGGASKVTGDIIEMDSCSNVPLSYGGVLLDNFAIGLTDDGNDPFDDIGDIIEDVVLDWGDGTDDLNPTLNGLSGYDPAKAKIKLKDGDNLTLPPGDYYFEKIEIDKNASLTITGETRLFIKKEIDIHDGQIINTTLDPLNLMIYHAGSKFHLKNAGNFYGYVVGADVDMKVEKATEFFGAFVGKKSEFKDGSSFHGDSSLPMFDMDRVPQLTR